MDLLYTSWVSEGLAKENLLRGDTSRLIGSIYNSESVIHDDDTPHGRLSWLLLGRNWFTSWKEIQAAAFTPADKADENTYSFIHFIQSRFWKRGTGRPFWWPSSLVASRLVCGCPQARRYAETDLVYHDHWPSGLRNGMQPKNQICVHPWGSSGYSSIGTRNSSGCWLVCDNVLS